MEEQTLLEWSSEKNVEKLLPSVRLRAEAIHIPDIEVVPSLLFFLPDLCIPRKSRLGRIYIPISKKFCKWRKFAPFLGCSITTTGFFLYAESVEPDTHTFKKNTISYQWMDPGKHVILKKTKLPLRANKHIGSRFDKVRSESEHTSDQHLVFYEIHMLKL